MDAPNSVTQLIVQVQNGDRQAANQLCDLYFPMLVRLARKELPEHARRAWDEEDAALSVLAKAVAGVEQNKYPDLKGRQDLWRLLRKMIRDRVIDEIRKNRRRPALGESKIGNPNITADGLQQFQDDRSEPHDLARLNDVLAELLDALDDDEYEPRLREVALMKLERYTNAEIAKQCCCAVATVERRLRTIRAIWNGLEQE